MEARKFFITPVFSFLIFLSASAQWSQTGDNHTTGNVGIGITNPSERLEVIGLIKIPAANNQDNNSPGIVALSNDDFIYDGEYLNHYGFGFHHYSASALNGRNAYISGYFGIDFFTRGGHRLRIENNGNVGIGTITPTAKLSVKGRIHAEEVKVDLNVPGPDFVFESDYVLKSLDEIDTYIKTHKHLPDVPSALEMKENGIKLSEMNMLLLQKVEELTLHMIQMKKDNEDLIKRVSQLEGIK